MDQGLVLQVETRNAGDVLDGDHAAGATLLKLTSVSSFASAGGTLYIGGSTLKYLLADEATSTITLDPTTPLPVAMLDEDSIDVVVLPAETEKWALFIKPDDKEADGEWAIIPHNLFDKVQDGIRDPDEQESIEVEWSERNSQWEVRNVIGKRPVIDGQYLLAGSVEDANTPDGVVPPQVTGVTTAAGVKAVYLYWPEVVNDNVTWYWVYGGSDPGVPIDADHRLGKAVAGRFTAYQVWDAGAPGLVPLTPGFTDPETDLYTPNLSYFRVVAEDADGMGTASAEVAAEPAVITSSDIAANSIIGEHIRGNAVEADHLEATLIHTSEQYIGDIHLHPTSGITIPQTGSDDTTHFAADGSGNQIAGGIIANDGLTSYGGVSMQGTDNFLAGELKAGSGINDPGTALTVTSSYDTASTGETAAVGGFQRKGMCDFHDASNVWVTTDSVSGASNLQAWAKTGGPGFWGIDILSGWVALGGVTRLGNYYYVLCRQNSNPANWKILIYYGPTKAYAGSYYSGGGTNYIATNALPSIGNDGTNLVIAWATAAGVLNVRRIYPVGGAVPGGQTGNTLNGGAWSASTNIESVQTVGSTMYIGYAASAVIRAYTVGSTTATRNTALEFPKNTGNLTGFVWDGTKFVTFTSGKTFTTHTTLEGQWDFGYDWADADIGGSGVAYTKLSPLRRITPVKFAKWTTTLPSYPQDDLTPDGANTSRIFAGPVGGAGLVLQHQLVTDGDGTTGKPLSLSKTFTSLATTGTAPNASNDFANRGGSVGRFSSTKLHAGGEPIWHHDGDGSGKSGPYKWTTAGQRAVYGDYTQCWQYNVGSSNNVDNAYTRMRFMTKTTERGISHNNASGQGLFTVTEAGLYRIIYRYTYASNLTGGRAIRVLKAGVSVAHDSRAPIGSNGTSMLISDEISFAAGDTFEIQHFQNSGTALAVFGGSQAFNHLTIEKIDN